MREGDKYNVYVPDHKGQFLGYRHLGDSTDEKSLGDTARGNVALLVGPSIGVHERAR